MKKLISVYHKKFLLKLEFIDAVKQIIFLFIQYNFISNLNLKVLSKTNNNSVNSICFCNLFIFFSADITCFELISLF